MIAKQHTINSESTNIISVLNEVNYWYLNSNTIVSDDIQSVLITSTESGYFVLITYLCKE